MIFLLRVIFILFLSTSLFADELVVEPEAGVKPIVSLINQAHTSIQLVMYGLTDSTLIRALNHAKQTGKQVQILLEPHPYQAEDENQHAIQALNATSISLQLDKPDFTFIHQKTMVIDHHTAAIMTFNFTHGSFTNERNFAIVTHNKTDIEDIQKIFNADWHHQSISINNPHLVFSPDDAREQILQFIQSARSSIKIYAENLTDYRMIGALAKKAREKILVEILLSEDQQDKLAKKLHYLKKAGVVIHFSKTYLIHAKVILIDQTRALLGSTNLTPNSLDKNRELSIFSSDPDVIHPLIDVFERDWKDAA